jgi:hypothetical protein
MREMGYASKLVIVQPEVKRPLRRLGLDSKLILKWIFGKQGGKVWIGCIWLRIRISSGLF